MTAKDGTVYGVYNQGHGDYVAAEDASGTHYAPSAYERLPDWTAAEAREHLRTAVETHDEDGDSEDDILEPSDWVAW